MEKTDREVESGTLTDNHDNEIPFHTERTPLLDYAVASSPFAGRIGGNQEFVISSRDHDAGEVLKKLPDAAPLVSLRDSLNPRGFLVSDNWRMAALEGWGTCLLVFLLGGMGSGLTAYEISPLASSLYGALATALGIAVFILAGAPVSGGHFNPIVTMATFFVGLSTLPRTLLYIAAQCLGSIVGSYLLRLGLGDAFFPLDVIPGCTVDPQHVSRGQLFVLEYIFAQALIFAAFGVGLDPRQAKVFGAALAPILVGFILGLTTLASSISKPGYTGVSANPARCLGLMVAKNHLQYHYVNWLADLAACMTNGLFYYFIPPYKNVPASETRRLGH